MMSSSTAFGSSPSAGPSSSKASSPTAHGVASGASAPNSIFPRSDGRASSSVPPSSLAHRQHKSAHGTPPHHPSVPQNSREVIELDDSDTDIRALGIRAKQPAPQPSRSNHLQPPFDPFPRGPSDNAAKPSHRASASPSIASLIHPEQPRPSLNPSPTAATKFPETNGRLIESNTEQPRPIDVADNANRSPKSKAVTAASSAATSPKPTRPAVPTGNGLLANVLPGMGGSGRNDEEPQVPTISIHVPLNGENNKYVNFTKLAEERYGWAALNPKLAKAREQMMLDSGDEMMEGSESESNVEMGGTGESTAPKKKRQKRQNDLYDKNDPFIDDSEMLWEEQAAASKDGFFVYSGPLIQPGEKPQIERADGTVKRARGRGRARGTSTRGGATTARKPRVTKKAKEQMEKEKEEREKFAAMHAATRGPFPH